MPRSLITLSAILIGLNLSAQDITPELLGFESSTLASTELGEVNYYLSKTDSEEEMPLLVYLDGSGSFPLFQKVEQGIGSTVVLDFQNLSKQYRILLISKPGVPFVDEVETADAGMPFYQEPETYTKFLSQDWRVKAANGAITAVLQKEKILEDQVIVLGFSEGAQVGPFVALENKSVTHLLLFGGNGLNQFYDAIINARLNAERGLQTHTQAQAEIDSLYTVFENIYAEPTSTSKQWYGHTYQRWGSFCAHDPVDALTQIDIPIYISNGSRDENSVLSVDYTRLEFLRLGKKNLTYKVYPDYDHQFNLIKFENGKFMGATPMLDQVMNDAFNWLNSNTK